MNATWRTVFADDLDEGEVYHFELKGGFVRGTFGGWINRGKGQPLVAMVVRKMEVLSFPLTEVLSMKGKPE